MAWASSGGRWIRRGMLSVTLGLAVLLLAAWYGAADAATTFTVNRTGDAADRRLSDDVCDTSRERGKQCTLRAAIEESNGSPGPDMISFNIGGTTPVKTISPTSALPPVTEQVTIDGYTQRGASANTLAEGNDAVLKVQLRGANAGTGVSGLTITGADSTIKGLVINRFKRNGILLQGSGATSNRIEGNYIGTDASGKEDQRNGGNGVFIQGASGNLIGGTEAGARNVISRNWRGVYITGSGATNNRVEGNYIGTDASGTRGLGNGGYGVQIWNAPGNLVGGTASGTGNAISGSFYAGVGIVGDTATNNRIEGNHIGTDAPGTRGLGNGLSGVEIDASDNFVGGTETGARNIISRNGYGVSIRIGTNNRIEGNYIGTDASGTKALGNHNGGVLIEGASANLVGGTANGAGNVISGNDGIGISIQRSFTTDNRVEGNYIGTDASGTKALGNRNFGVMIFGASTNSTIGQGNTIAHNASGGIRISGSGNEVEGNIIEANGGSGVDLTPTSSDALGYPTNDNTIGGATSAQANVIRDNEGAGVRVGEVDGASSAGNSILTNQIFRNVDLGIDMGSASGVTANDEDDSDTGANNRQNFPVITEAVRDSATGVTTITGTLNSTPSQTYTIQCFLTETGGDPSGHGEGQIFLGQTTTTTDASGDSPTFTCTSDVPTTDDKVSMTATNTSGTATNTRIGDASELSENELVVQP